MRKPADGPISLKYGATSPPYSASSPHLGTDIANSAGTPIVAPHAGKVTISGSLGDCGLAVEVDGGHFKSRLCHNSQVLVSLNQNVSEGQQVAKMGSTGLASGPHCHHAFWVDGQRTDAELYYGSGDDVAEPADYRVNDGDIENYFVNLLGRKPTAQDLGVYRGKTHKEIAYAIMGSAEFKNRQLGDFVQVDFPVFKKK